jgi:hypothetical protein
MIVSLETLRGNLDVQYINRKKGKLVLDLRLITRFDGSPLYDWISFIRSRATVLSEYLFRTYTTMTNWYHSIL